MKLSYILISWIVLIISLCGDIIYFYYSYQNVEKDAEENSLQLEQIKINDFKHYFGISKRLFMDFDLGFKEIQKTMTIRVRPRESSENVIRNHENTTFSKKQFVANITKDTDILKSFLSPQKQSGRFDVQTNYIENMIIKNGHAFLSVPLFDSIESYSTIKSNNYKSMFLEVYEKLKSELIIDRKEDLDKSIQIFFTVIELCNTNSIYGCISDDTDTPSTTLTKLQKLNSTQIETLYKLDTFRLLIKTLPLKLTFNDTNFNLLLAIHSKNYNQSDFTDAIGSDVQNQFTKLLENNFFWRKDIWFIQFLVIILIYCSHNYFTNLHIKRTMTDEIDLTNTVTILQKALRSEIQHAYPAYTFDTHPTWEHCVKVYNNQLTDKTKEIPAELKKAYAMILKNTRIEDKLYTKLKQNVTKNVTKEKFKTFAKGTTITTEHIDTFYNPTT